MDDYPIGSDGMAIDSATWYLGSAEVTYCTRRIYRSIDLRVETRVFKTHM